ncbi:TRAP transporter permease [Paenirhodobacter populi]|uniref:TRAP transporter fused permease subunit n=1 Tax=Paenirhodobacter populi TaxID=2306993 RepID=A0A443J6H2_9RHOB|nr:TRAP transporter permease [Sinirhodobacter populi]RWR16162.1 TRAP transporter fused permease subunit [Sinirhodobacter populi]
MTTKPDSESVDLEQLVAEVDTGGRHPYGLAARILTVVAVAWSLFQLWIASPLPFWLGFGVLNDTETRAIHLGFAMFLAFTAFPALKSSPRDRIPVQDWIMALLGAFCGSYLFLFYDQLATRPGQPTTMDITAGIAGFVLLLEATRRALGIPMVIVALVFVVYSFGGQHMPEVIQHRGASLTKFVNHQWLTTEGVFGIALGVSSSFVFLFVLFGTLLEKVGGGNWMMQISVALLGHLRGGPAKVAVVSSALNGVVSGSSVSNVVSGGIFTIPLMKRTGLSGIKAGAIEAASSINGQIMPPVMGAAAFLMVEYVGIPYSQVIRHALLPALFSYISLLYIVHLEAIKIGSQPIAGHPMDPRRRMIRWGLGLSGTVLVLCLLYWGVLGIKAIAGAEAGGWLMAAGGALYVLTVAFSARYPDLEMDDPNAPILHLPLAWDVARTGLDFLIPIVVLLWCLMVEMMSPGLSAFYATVSVIVIVASRKAMVAFFRKQDVMKGLRDGLTDLWDGLALGARNMIGIGVATATAGIVVGTITLTGLGLMMTEFVEYISGGDVILMLVMVAAISLILGLGIPTTANYILVSSLMAPVVVSLASQAGMSVPLIAVHMFVFYFGIMADITPPVGLAGFAAAAISREDPIKTSFQGALYSLRTAILPFVFIFNPSMLLIDVHSWWETAWQCLTALIAILLFAAASMNWFVTRNRIWETVALLVICFSLFRPDWWLNQFSDPYESRPPSEFMQLLAEAPTGTQFRFTVEGYDLMGDEVSRTVNLRTIDGSAEDRLSDNGVTLTALGDGLMIGPVRFGSYAARMGLEPGLDVTGVLVRAPQPSALWPTGLALVLLAGVALNQWRRKGRAAAACV